MVVKLCRPWRRRLGKPVATMSKSFAGSKETRRTLMRVVALPERYIHRRMQKLTVSLRAVERPAPAMPMPSAKMRKRSPAMLSRPPVIMPIMPSVARPS